MNTRQRRTLLGLTAVATGMGLFTTAAQAAVPPPEAPQAPVAGYTIVSRAGVHNSSRTHSVLARCPAGKVALGGGVRIVGGQNRVLLRGSYPQRNGWVAVAQELVPRDPGSGMRAAWHVVAHAVCAKAPAGLTYEARTSASTSGPWKTAQVFCPAGKRLLAAGGRMNGADFKAGLNSVAADSRLRSATVRGGEATPTSALWSVTAYGVCTGPLGQTLRESVWQAVSGAAQSGTAFAACPRGTRAFGAGVRLSGNAGVLNRLVPVELRSTVRPPGARTTVSELGSGLAATWHLKAQVICAP
ncbi:hypothetical protein [Streptomyces sp. NPDC057253]|uniref:hypothetical protein n=1 Tax=Streptomyces sp. NPDC057253 TaxID=3346069 RepID=UPI00363FEC27